MCIALRDHADAERGLGSDVTVLATEAALVKTRPKRATAAWCREGRAERASPVSCATRIGAP